MFSSYILVLNCWENLSLDVLENRILMYKTKILYLANSLWKVVFTCYRCEFHFATNDIFITITTLFSEAD